MFPQRWLIPFISLSLALLGGSISLNFLLFSQAKKYYLELNQTRLDPIGDSNYHSAKQPPVTRQPRVVFFGDSRAENWQAPSLSSYQFVNRGISSQTSVQAIARFDQHVRPLQPKIVLVQIGINDLKTIALFPEQKASIIERIVQESRKLGAIVILTTILPAGEVPIQRKPFWSNEIDQAVKEMNAYIATLASDQVIVFDAYSLIANQQGLLPAEYRLDELHLNSKGYEVLNQGLVQQMLKLK
jgi:lysophospholipase L1-like esterase